MNYKELLEALTELNEEELQLTATIYDKTDDTYFIVEFTDRTKEDDTIDKDHPVIVINDDEKGS